MTLFFSPNFHDFSMTFHDKIFSMLFNDCGNPEIKGSSLQQPDNTIPRFFCEVTMFLNCSACDLALGAAIMEHIDVHTFGELPVFCVLCQNSGTQFQFPHMGHVFGGESCFNGSIHELRSFGGSLITSFFEIPQKTWPRNSDPCTSTCPDNVRVCSEHITEECFIVDM